MARWIDADELKENIFSYANEPVKLNDRRWNTRCVAIIADMNGIVDNMPTIGGWISVKEVANIIADLFGDVCACNSNGIDEWLPQYCEYRDTDCPHPPGVACWEQYLKHLDKKPNGGG